MRFCDQVADASGFTHGVNFIPSRFGRNEGAKTFLIDLPVMILFGALFSIFEFPHLKRSIFSSRFFWHGVIFTSIFNLAVVYAILYYPDWMWMYFLEDSTNSTSELIYIFLFLYYLPYTLGFYLGYDFKNVSKALWGLLIFSLIATEAWLIIKLFDRYSVVGTREEYLSGTAISLFSPQNPLGPVLNGSVVAMIVYFIFVYIQYKRTRKTIQL